jgi:hypothetical protein
LTIPKPAKNQHHGEELKTENDGKVKLQKNVDLFSGIALIVGTMIGKEFI